MNNIMIKVIGGAALLAASGLAYAICTRCKKIEYRDKYRSVDIYFGINEVIDDQEPSPHDYVVSLEEFFG